MNRKVGLIILDGWGLGDHSNSDAIYNAQTPFFDQLMSKYANATLVACGEAVGLPEGHIFHVITKGKGRMGAHGSQIPAESRWKIVHYVKQVIQGQAAAADSIPAADSTAVATENPAK